MLRQYASEKRAFFNVHITHILKRFLFWSRKKVWYRVLLLLLPINLLVVYLHFAGQSVISQAGAVYYSTLYGHQEVLRKSDLLNVDISSKLKFQKWSRSPITNSTLHLEYVKERLLGYVSNLDFEEHRKVHNVKNSLDSSDGKPKDDERLLKWESDYHYGYDNLVDCADLEYTGELEHSKWSKILEDDLTELRRDLLKRDDSISKEIKDPGEKDWSEEYIIKKRWFRFGASPVWLEKEQCYVMFSRVIYSKVERRGHPKFSLLRGQAFDKSWNELKGKRIPYDDVIIPSDLEEQLQLLDQELGVDDCKLYKKVSESQYNTCKVEQAKKKLNIERRKEAILSKYFITYPTVLDIKFSTDGDWRGPEDPKVVLKKTPTPAGVIEEPIVMFDMHDDAEGKRRMFAYWPHRKNDPQLKFTAEGFEQRPSEKNWTPFFHPTTDECTLSRGFVHFIYTFFPLEVLKCSLNDGICEKVFEASTLQLSKDAHLDSVRGGTPYIPLPDILPEVKGKKLWVGFAKLHVNGCGCGDRFYRPILSLLVESNGVYHQEVAVPAINFDVDVLSWDLKGQYCRGINILSPNSIAFWNVVGQDPVTKQFDDYMALTLSEADAMTRVIYVRGLLNYLLGIYRDKVIKEDLDVTPSTELVIGRTMQCIDKESRSACKKYGEAHPDPKAKKTS